MENETFDAEALNFPELTDEVTGNEPQVEPVVEVKEDPKPETTVEPVTPEPKPTEPEVTDKISISDPPSKYEGESDIQHKLRTDIWLAGQAKAQAETPEEVSELAKHIKGLRKELALNHKSSEPLTAPEPQIETNESSEEDLAKEALKKMGYLSKDEVAQMVAELVTSKATQDAHLQATQEFYAMNKDVAPNPELKKSIENFVVNRMNITPESSKQDLLIAMDVARNYLAPRNDTRSQRAAQAADKRDLVGITSNTQSVPTTNKADEKTAAGLKELGLSPKDMGWD
jgi:hypothetical protein